jgi:hypothetical protein
MTEMRVCDIDSPEGFLLSEYDSANAVLTIGSIAKLRVKKIWRDFQNEVSLAAFAGTRQAHASNEGRDGHANCYTAMRKRDVSGLRTACELLFDNVPCR